MKQLKITDIEKYVESNIGIFHQKRIDSLKKLKLKTILKKKNPYLYKAKYLLTAQDIIKRITDAFISSNEDTIFGDWLEGLAIFVNTKVYGGRKSTSKGIDLEFEKEDVRYLVSIKSGPNWGNSSQINKLISDFNSAIKTLKTSNSKINVVVVNGCCYGTDNNPLKNGNYFKFCGQEFWGFISGNSNLYVDIIEPLGYKAKEKNDIFIQSYSEMINRFTKEFIDNFCKPNGEINWVKLVEFNSKKKM